MTKEDLRAWRAARGWGLETMAARTGSSRRALWNYEEGITPVPLILVLALEALDVREAVSVMADAVPAPSADLEVSLKRATRTINALGSFLAAARGFVERTAAHMEEIS